VGVASACESRRVEDWRGNRGWCRWPATGDALVALAESGVMPPSGALYRRGVDFLLRTQFADRAWFVKSRAIPRQPHFESGLLFVCDQFISAAGTNWAARALAVAHTNTP
jgi:hypothetical protein